MAKDITYDARYSDMHEEGQYRDLLIPFDFYDAFQADTGKKLGQYIEVHCRNSSNIQVLEAGSGTGVTTRELLNIDPRITVVAVDNEAKMVDITKARYSKESDLKERVEFVHADILSFLESSGDNSYDAFVSVYTLHNFSSDYRRKVINLVSKKLKQGGIFINGDKYAREGDDHRADFASEIKNHDKFDIAAHQAEKQGDITKALYWRRLKEEGIQHAKKDEEIKITVKEQEDMLKEFGFLKIEWGKRYDLVTTVSAIKQYEKKI